MTFVDMMGYNQATCGNNDGRMMGHDQHEEVAHAAYRMI
jgi:hypothetical protein